MIHPDLYTCLRLPPKPPEQLAYWESELERLGNFYETSEQTHDLLAALLGALSDEERNAFAEEVEQVPDLQQQVEQEKRLLDARYYGSINVGFGIRGATTCIIDSIDYWRIKYPGKVDKRLIEDVMIACYTVYDSIEECVSLLAPDSRTLRVERLDADDLCRRQIEALNCYEWYQGRVQYVGPSKPCWCSVDRHLIGLCIHEMVFNSISNSPPDSIVRARLQIDGQDVMFSVHYNRKQRARVDQSPYNPDTASELRIVQRAAEIHGGGLTIQDLSPTDQIVTLCIPCAAGGQS